MTTSYEAAVLELHQLTPEVFVGERKRLAAALKAEGQKDDAARLLKLQRPTVSVWLVNQLYARERSLFDELFASAAALRAGDRASSTSHRNALASLRERAIAVLSEAGRPVQDAVIRRVMTTLSTLAANGGFEPDLPGALTSDREATGFDVAVTFPAGPGSTTVSGRISTDHAPPLEADPVDAEQKRKQESEAEAARQREAARAERAAERARIEADLKAARVLIESLESKVEGLRTDLERAERELATARQSMNDAAGRLAGIDANDEE